MLDSIWRDLSYSLHQLIGVFCFVPQPVDHSGWFAAKGGMWRFVIVELDPLSDACLRFRSGFPGTQINAFLFQASPQSFDKNVIEEPTLAIHGNTNAGSPQSVGPD